jgi:hypothetical protein
VAGGRRPAAGGVTSAGFVESRQADLRITQGRRSPWPWSRRWAGAGPLHRRRGRRDFARRAPTHLRGGASPNRRFQPLALVASARSVDVAEVWPSRAMDCGRREPTGEVTRETRRPRQSAGAFVRLGSRILSGQLPRGRGCRTPVSLKHIWATRGSSA